MQRNSTHGGAQPQKGKEEAKETTEREQTWDEAFDDHMRSERKHKQIRAQWDKQRSRLSDAG